MSTFEKIAGAYIHCLATEGYGRSSKALFLRLEVGEGWSVRFDVTFKRCGVVSPSTTSSHQSLGEACRAYDKIEVGK